MVISGFGDYFIGNFFFRKKYNKYINKKYKCLPEITEVNLWEMMFEKKQLFSSVYDKYVTPWDCQCPIIKANKTNQTDDNGRTNSWFCK